MENEPEVITSFRIAAYDGTIWSLCKCRCKESILKQLGFVINKWDDEKKHWHVHVSDPNMAIAYPYIRVLFEWEFQNGCFDCTLDRG